jgi:hypothetical protein
MSDFARRRSACAALSRVILRLHEHLLDIRQLKVSLERQAEILENMQLAGSDFVALDGIRLGEVSAHVTNEAGNCAWRQDDPARLEDRQSAYHS